MVWIKISSPTCRILLYIPACVSFHWQMPTLKLNEKHSGFMLSWEGRNTSLHITFVLTSKYYWVNIEQVLCRRNQDSAESEFLLSFLAGSVGGAVRGCVRQASVLHRCWLRCDWLSARLPACTKHEWGPGSSLIHPHFQVQAVSLLLVFTCGENLFGPHRRSRAGDGGGLCWLGPWKSLTETRNIMK